MALSKVGGNQIDTVNGDLTVDTNTLHVDATNNRVGVGTAPSQPLHVKGGAVQLENTQNTYLQVNTADTHFYTAGSHPLRFGTNSTERMRINSNGRVCIGGTSPSQKFVVTNAGADNIVMAENSSASIQMFMQATSSTGSVGTLTNHPVQFLSNNTERLRIDSIGRMIFATGGSVIQSAKISANYDSNSGPGICLQDVTPQNGNTFIRFINAGTTAGQILSNGGNSTTYATSSDHRLKENVEDMTGAIARVKTLSPKRFSWIVDNLDSPNIDGFLAHEAQAVVPEAVTGTHNEVDADGNAVMQGIDQAKLVPLLTAALKESIAKIETLEARVTALENA